MSDDPYKKYSFVVYTDPLPEPSAVDRLAAISDPAAAKRIADYEAEVDRRREDAELVKRISESPSLKQWRMEINQ